MELDFNLESDRQMDLYCDLLVRYLLVGSALGECELHRHLGAALDSGDAERMGTALRSFESLPEELRGRIMDGDPTLATEMERDKSAEKVLAETARAIARRSASA